MREVNNPYKGLDGYLCFGCCPDNEFGLRLKFSENGEFIESEWEPASYFQGYKNILHGGIQASLLDEIAGWVVSVKQEKRIATVEAQLLNSKGISCAEAVIEYYVLPEEKAKRDFHYPGKEKF